MTQPPRSPRLSPNGPKAAGRHRPSVTATDDASVPLQQSLSPDSLAHYQREISRLPLLTPAEEIELAKRARAGEPGALDQLVERNLRFVVSAARKFERMAPIEDLIQEGNIGLMRAAEKFDPDRGVRFVGYAKHWIEQSMRAHLAAVQRPMRLPINRQTQLLHVRRAAQTLHTLLKHQPTIQEIALATSIPSGTIRTLMEADRQEHSLQDLGHDGTGASMADRLADVGAQTDGRLLSSDRARAIERLLEVLRPRDAQVLRLWFGIGTGRAATLDEIGQTLSVTRERVRQIRDRAILRLRQSATDAEREWLQDVFFDG